MFLLTVLTILICIVSYLVKDRLRYKRMINVFPGRDDGHFLFGDAYNLPMERDGIFKEFRNYSQLFPNGYRIWSVWYGIVCVNTPERAEIILSNVRYIRKSLIYDHLHPWLQTGLLTSTGEKWFQRRKLLTPAFHFNILKKLTQNFEEHNEYLLELLKEECKKDKTDVMTLISSVALNIICGTSMGVSLNVNDQKSNEYRKAIYGFPEILTGRINKPWLHIGLLFRFSYLYKVQKKLLHVLHGFTTDIIKKREVDFDETEFEDNDETYGKRKLAMLDLLLSAKKRGEIDDEGIREEVDTFTFEGHDTVSMAISFALMVIANQKDHQKKIIEEINEIFGESDRCISFQDLQNMHYLELCLKESLRLYPSVPFISRRAEEDIPLDEEHIVPKGALVHIHIYDIHRNKEHFPDPEKFDPSRFLPENSKNRHPYAYIPFSAGPRNCIGQKYAMLEMKSIFATILRKYELEPVDTPETIIMSMEMVLRTKDGIKVKFVPRIK